MIVGVNVIWKEQLLVTAETDVSTTLGKSHHHTPWPQSKRIVFRQSMVLRLWLLTSLSINLLKTPKNVIFKPNSFSVFYSSWFQDHRHIIFAYKVMSSNLHIRCKFYNRNTSASQFVRSPLSFSEKYSWKITTGELRDRAWLNKEISAYFEMRSKLKIKKLAFMFRGKIKSPKLRSVQYFSGE